MLLRSEFCLDIAVICDRTRQTILYLLALGAKICGVKELLTVKNYTFANTALIYGIA
ncbi:hypothetical protein [Crinalium epipsammum]|uniref:hypothetical protein n=1 Tax=Crinalium epipsammum TaxID=241425 RepID=UPI000308749A|nr:hypothetical protein [Crinalium epipsammum]